MDTHKERLQKYFEGACTPEELQRLFEDLQAHDSEEYEEILADIWEKLEGASPAPGARRMFHKIRQQIEPESHSQTPLVSGTQQGASRISFPWMAGVAAAVLLLLGVVVSFQWQQSPALRTVSTAYGEITTIDLPDGSTVMLNGNSSLRFAADEPEGDLREVWLTGEAYFQVERKPGKTLPLSRFIVHTQRLGVEVVGTTFNINDRADKTQVVLHSGEVRILQNRSDDVRLTMQPGQMVEASQAAPELKQAVVTAEDYASWTRKELVFEKMPLADIARRLEDTYGFTVEFADPSLRQLVFTGRTGTDELLLFWQIVGRSFDLKITQNENHVWIESR